MRIVAPRFTLVMLVAIASVCHHARGQSFLRVAPLPGAATVALRAISGNGRVVVGTSGGKALRWSLETGSQEVPGMTDATATNRDGSVIVGHSGPNAVRWSASSGTVLLSRIPTADLGPQVLGISGDGRVAVGWEGLFGTTAPCSWDVTGVAALVPLPGYFYGKAWAANLDGSIVVGDNFGETTAFRWASATGSTYLPDSVSARGITSDGAIIVGTNNQGLPALWFGNGAKQTLPVPGQSYGGFGCGVTTTGDTAVGFHYCDPGLACLFVWQSSAGSLNISEYLSAKNINQSGWVFSFSTATDHSDVFGSNLIGCSENGKVLFGNGRYLGNRSGWVFSEQDQDEDGLLDDWETNGIPYTKSDGTQGRYILPDADPQVRDLYVEVDSMTGFSLSPAAIEKVKNAFAAAPGPGGIRLHIVPDDSHDIPLIAQWQTTSPTDCWPVTFNDLRTSYFGTVTEKQGVDAVARLAAKEKAFRYCIVADRSIPALGGCGQIGGDNFVVFFGGNTSGPPITDPETQAAIFMHELGHCLGLEHGGDDDINGKPNYPSIMNYTLAYKAPWNEWFWRLDFSRAGPDTLRSLHESSLDENVGVGSSTGRYASWFLPFGVNQVNGSQIIRTTDYLYLDGRSPIDFGDEAGAGFQDDVFSSSVAQDLNFAQNPPPGIRLPGDPSPGQHLHAFDDWSNIRLQLRAAMPEAARGAVGYPKDELTFAARDWIAANFPVPPVACRADFNADNTVNTPDLVFFLGRFGQPVTPGSPAERADFNADGIVSTPDLVFFLGRFGQPCP